MSFIDKIKEWLFGSPPPPPPPNESDPMEVLNGRRKDAVSDKESMKATSTDWYSLNPATIDKHKEVSVFVRYSFADIAILTFLKEERIRKEKERLEALTNETNSNLSKIESYVENENLQNSEALLQKVTAAIPKIQDPRTAQRYKNVQGKVETLRNELERRKLQRLAEEQKKKDEEERKRREREEREQREREERQRKERERREEETRKLAEEARKKELAEKAERERLLSLSSQLKPEVEEIKSILSSNGIRCLYHFTDRRNIPSIKRHGGLMSWHYMKSHNITIPCQGGDSDSEELDVKYGLQDYVRLSFCCDHPMAYRLKQSGSNLVLLRMKIDVAWFKNTMFSDINAADKLHTHGGELEDLQRVDFRATQRTFVRKDDEDFKTHQAEVMVKTFVPLEYIINIDNPQRI